VTSIRPFDVRPIDSEVLKRTLACRDCGYDLRGLPLGGVCPECGTPVWQTILALIDPETSRLPRLRNPRAVGNGLLLCAVCLLLIPVLLGLGPALRGLCGLLSLPGPSPDVVDLFGLGAAAAAFIGFFAGQDLGPRKDDPFSSGVRRQLLYMAMGFAVTGTSVLFLVLGGWYRIRLSGRGWIPHEAISLSLLAVATLGGVLFAVLAFGAVLRTVGERSREYRTNLAARQRTRDLGLAIAIVIVLECLRLNATAHDYPGAALLAATLAIAAFSMVIIGFAYLSLNCYWIRRSLRRPPPTILELITPLPEVPSVEMPGDSDPPSPHSG